MGSRRIVILCRYSKCWLAGIQYASSVGHHIPPPLRPVSNFNLTYIYLKVVITLLLQMLQMLAGRDPTMLHMLHAAN
jgi:hypothetical protein